MTPEEREARISETLAAVYDGSITVRGGLLAILNVVGDAIAEERKAFAVIARSPDTPYRRVYETYDLPDAIREGIAAAIEARSSDCGQANPRGDTATLR